jgi:hypothetical protein
MTDRRSFLKNTVTTATGLLILPLFSFDEKELGAPTADALESGFLNPPLSARPMAYWMWMNGQVTKQGITLDIRAMKGMGLAGALLFNAGLGVPKGPVVYGSATWHEMVLHAMTEAKKAGLELFLHNAPGYSSTGGAKVLPEAGMQQLVWTEVKTESNGTINVQLPQPFARLGYYRDAFVVAFPSGADRTVMQEELLRVTANGKAIEKERLSHQTASAIELSPTVDGKAILQMEFSEPFEARSIAVWRIREPSVSVYDDAFDHPPDMVLQSSIDGVRFDSVCTVSMPFLRSIEAPGTQNFPPVKANYFRLVTSKRTTLTGVELYAGPRLNDWPGKTNATGWDKKETDQHIEPPFIIDPASVLDLSDKLQQDGRLSGQLPSGHWTILRMGHTCTGTTSIAAPEGAGGLEIDKFSKEAVDLYFTLYLDDLLQTLSPFIAKTFKGLTIDSYEIGRQNWTARFPETFAQKRGYGMAAWMPAFTGRIVQGVKSTEAFLWDVRRVQADLVAENYYGHFKKRCAAYGLQFLAQPYGDGVFDGLQAGQYPDVPMGEFWTRSVPGTLNQSKQVVAAAHGYGKKTVAAEAFTGMPFTSRWTEYPYALKGQGDYLFAMGINRFVFHVFVHQPYTTGFPGMTMGPYGTHFDRNSTWCRKATGWMNYLNRTQYLLQQGLPVSDVLYFKGEEPASGIPDIRYVDPPVPPNLSGDVIGPDVLLNRISIVDNKIVLPDGMQYRLLILAPLKKLSVSVVQRLKTLVQQGMILIVTTRPTGTPGLSEKDELVRQLVDELWGDLDGQQVKERNFGRGKLYWNEELGEILAAHNILPDFEFSATGSDAAIHYTHRVVGETDVYFIANHLRRRETLVARFRVLDRQPEIWDAQTGERSLPAVYAFENKRVRVPLVLGPSGSLFVVFRKKAAGQTCHSVEQNGVYLLSARDYPIVPPAVYPAITDNFTILLWAKPDTQADPPKGVLIFPPEGEKVYGTGHAACGMAAGQNGVRVFEREAGPNHSAREMIRSSVALEGWTHLALRYNDGKPALLINGLMAGSAGGSGKIIHPGLGTAPTDEAFSAFFEGAMTRPELVTEALSDDAILRRYQQGLPQPDLPFPLVVQTTKEGALKATAWQNGDYWLTGDGVEKKLRIDDCRVIPLESSWQVRFPPRSGAPLSISLKKLLSLHRHPHFGVRHFSGTATYLTFFRWDEKNMAGAQRVLLDLGRVEVLAEVELNGNVLGTLWKEPYSMDITKRLRHGANELKIKVTNLWPNRMIGDEYLPEEDRYDQNDFVVMLPDWYTSNREKQGERITFSVWNNFRKTDPLLESGLLGPVRLIVGVEKTLS